MGFSRNSTTPTKEVKDNLAQGAICFRNAGMAAARGTRDAAAPRVNGVLTRVGVRKQRSSRWPWVIGAIGAGVAAGGAAAYLWYRRRTESIGESLLADELLEDTEQNPRITDEAINEELIEHARH